MKKTEIYLLEDMPDDVYIIRHMLGGEKSTKFTIHNFPLLDMLQKALNLSRPDILLVDLNLPGSSGLETLVKVRSMAPDIPIIVLTNGEEETLSDRAIQLGAQDFIPKSELNPALLKRALRFAKERHSLQLRLQNLVAIDELTLVHNKNSFDEKLKLTIKNAELDKRKFCLVVIDLNEFKLINKKHGHISGDQVLRSVGAKLKSLNRSSDFVARYGGDEFVVIANDISEIHTAHNIAKNHYDKLKGKYFISIDEKVEVVSLSLNVGCAVYPDHGKDYEALFNIADNALRKAKKENVGYWVD